MSAAYFTGLRASFDAQHLVRLAPFVPAHDIRYYLCGLCIERSPLGGVVLIATNGHMLGAIHDAQGTLEGAEQVILKVSPGLTMAARRAAPSRRDRLGAKVLLRGTRAFVAPDFESEGTDLERFVQAGRSVIEGRFPVWQKVLPDFTRLRRGGLKGGDDRDGMVNPAYLAVLNRVEAGVKHPGVMFWSQPGRSSLYVQFNSVPEMFAVIMPMRSDPDDATLARLSKAFHWATGRPTGDVPLPGKQPSDAEVLV